MGRPKQTVTDKFINYSMKNIPEGLYSRRDIKIYISKSLKEFIKKNGRDNE